MSDEIVTLRTEMSDNLLDVITLCDHSTCPTIKSNNEAYGMIVVKPVGESQPLDSCIGHRLEPDENRAIGDAHP